MFVSLQDLEGDRVDETTDLFDSYDIRRPFDSSASCSMVNFDEESKIATFLIQIDWYITKNVLGSKVTFSLKEFLSNKQELDNVPINVDLTDVSLNPKTQSGLSFRGGSYVDSEDEELLEDDNAKCLVPVEGGMVSPVDGVTVTGIGYIDGKLRIQTYYENIFDFDNHGYIYIIDKDGNKYHCEQFVSFWDDEEIGSYDEEVFDISPEVLKDSKLYGCFVISDTNTKGDWEVTFQLN